MSDSDQEPTATPADASPGDASQSADSQSADSQSADSQSADSQSADSQSKGRLGRIFLLVWLGQTVAFFGSRVTAFAVGISLFQATGSVTRFTLIGLAIALPTIFLSPLAGTLADRFPRRLILLAATFGSALGTLGIWYLVRADMLEAGHLYWMIALKAAFTAFVWPTFGAATTLLVAKQHFARASGLSQMGQAVGRIAGPLAGGALLAAVPLEHIILLEVATFLLSALTLLYVRFPEPPRDADQVKQRAKGHIGAGWAFLRRHPGLLHLLLVFAALNFCVGFVQVLLTPMVLSFTSPLVLGTVLSIAACGMLVGGSVMSVWGGPATGKRIQAILFITALEGAFLMVAGLRSDATLITIAAFFFLLGFPFIGGTSQAIWQSKVPPELQGRVFALRGMVAGGSVPLAIAAAGPLSDHVFEPLMAAGGPLADSVGIWLGIGPGRGIALLLLLLGAALFASAIIASRSKALLQVETEVPDAIADDEVADQQRQQREEKLRQPEKVLQLPLVPALALATVLIAVTALAIASQRPPQPLGEDASATEFSAQRAMQHLSTVAAEPHPTGSLANQRVRDYLLQELEALGLESEVQEARVAVDHPVLARLITVENVIARLPGSVGRRSDAILLVAHYDSVFQSNGAADNGAGVVALLETARALSAAQPTRQDVIFLFTDAEEVGLAGARAFLRHRWSRDVAVLLNLDARGHYGPVYMFQTGADNGWWIRQFLDGAPQPLASSLMNQVYQRLPNVTDFNAFLEHGFQGFNFAFIGGLTHYHNMLDTAADLDARSVQHQGSYVHGLARHFADLDLAAVPVDERVQPGRTYFNLFGYQTVGYSRLVAGATAVLCLLLGLWVLRSGLRRGRLSAFGLGQGFLAFFAMTVAIPAVITLLWFAVRDLGNVPVVMGSTYAAPWFMVAFAAFGLALFVIMYRFFRRLISIFDFAGGALLGWLLLVLVASGLYLPMESNFFFVWPSLFASATLGYLLSRSPHDAQQTDQAGHRGRTAAWLLAGALPSILLVAPLLGALYTGLQGLFELGGAALALEVLWLGLLLPQIEALGGRRGPWLLLPSVIAGFLLLALALTSPAVLGPELRQHGEQHQANHASLFYAADTDRGDAHWYSTDRRPAAWQRDLGLQPGQTASVNELFPWARRSLLAAPADFAPPSTTTVEVVAARQLDDGLMELRLQVRSTARQRSRTLWIEPADAAVALEWHGETIDLSSGGQPGQRQLIHQVPALATDEWLLRVRAQKGSAQEGSVQLIVIDQTDGLPAVDGVNPWPADLQPRPTFMMVENNTSLVRHSFRLPLTERMLPERMPSERVPPEAAGPQEPTSPDPATAAASAGGP